MENVTEAASASGHERVVISMIRRVLSLSILLFFACHPALADEHVSARIGAHGAYSRLVFEWPAPVTCSVKQENGGALIVTFARAATLDASAVKNDANVTSVTAISAAGQPLAVRISSPPGGRFSNFTAGNRVIVDIYGGAAAKAKPATVAESEKPAPAKAPEKPKTSATKTEPEKKAPVQKIAEQKAPAAQPKAEPAPVAEAVKPRGDTHVITVSETEEVGLAAFVRGGNLWIVLDRTGVVIAPIITGPHPDIFSAFRRIEFTGGVAFVTKLPDNPDLEIYGDGGGLVWKLTVTPEARDVTPVVMQRNFSSDQAPAGVTVFWPLPGATKILEVPDADAGDTIRVVTVNDASQFAGPLADTIDFTALRSIVGLAVVTKADNLTIGKAAGGIRVSRPQGLTLSPQKDISLRQMRHDVAAPLPALPSSSSSPQEVRRIFDFEKWQMGGLRAVEDNQRILKAGLDSKDKDGQVQDLLTLAKMNLANDRAQ